MSESISNNAKAKKKTTKTKRLKYSNADITKALTTIRQNPKLSLRGVSKKFNIPRSTLSDIINGRSSEVKPINASGPKPFLTVEGEEKIVEWVINSASIGFPVRKYNLCLTVQKIINDSGIKTPFKNNYPGDKWYKLFLKRHPHLSQRTSEGISKGRAIVTEEALRLWFKGLKDYLESIKCLDILEDPSRIVNGDETAFQLCPKTGKVLCPKKWKNIYEINVGNEKETITVLLFITAAGKTVIPMIVYPYVRIPEAISNSVPEEWSIGRSESGWMRSETFYEYMANDFNKWLNENNIKRPILCLVDGHKSHLTMHLSEFCSNNQIILYSLLPNSTHIIQPADVSVFKPLKTNWRKTVLEWKSIPENFDKTLSKETFAPLVKLTLERTSLESSIINGFKACGLYPFEPNNVDYSKCVKNTAEKLHASNSNNTEIGEIIINEECLVPELLSLLDKISPQLLERGIESNVIKEEIAKKYSNKDMMSSKGR